MCLHFDRTNVFQVFHSIQQNKNRRSDQKQVLPSNINYRQAAFLGLLVSLRARTLVRVSKLRLKGTEQ